MTTVAYTHLDTPNNDILSSVKARGFRVADRRGPLGPIGTVRLNERFTRIGITILGGLMSTAVTADIPSNFAAGLKARAIKAFIAYRRLCERLQRSNDPAQLKFASRERGRTR